MITNFLLACILGILSLDFYFKNRKIIKEKPKWEFSIHKKWVWETIVQELDKEL